MKIWILPTATLAPLGPLLEDQLRQRGIMAEVKVTAFGEMEQQALGAGSTYRTARPEVTILAPDSHDLLAQVFESPLEFDGAKRMEAIDHAAERVEMAVSAASSVSPRVLLCTGCSPPVNPLGLLEADSKVSLRGLTEDYNRRLEAFARRQANVTVVDYAGLVMQLGYERFHDARLWAMARMRVSADGLRCLAKLLARVLAAQSRRPRKCIVLDLDNTLWGGVLGEEGFDGIAIGEDGIGLAFAQFQRELLALHSRGILLAIASKNDEAQALDIIDRHPGMVLRRKHLAAHRIGWQPKTESLAQIAKELGFDTSALVFVDDSAHECEAIRMGLPDITVVNLPDDPASYVEVLRSCEELDALQITEEDRGRNQMVLAEKQRTELRAATPDLESFLRGLEQEAILEPLGDANIARAEQLCQRTNQFNLTLRRHDGAALHGVMTGAHVGVLLRARDRLGDSGIVGFALAVPCGADIWDLDTFVLSCRVIGRGLETVVLSEVAKAVFAKGADRLVGRYVPGPRNSVCADFLPRHGFQPMEDGPTAPLCLTSNSIHTPDYIKTTWA
jgi:FkbH-like protein